MWWQEPPFLGLGRRLEGKGGPPVIRTCSFFALNLMWNSCSRLRELRAKLVQSSSLAETRRESGSFVAFLPLLISSLLLSSLLCSSLLLSSLSLLLSSSLLFSPLVLWVKVANELLGSSSLTEARRDSCSHCVVYVSKEVSHSVSQSLSQSVSH